MMGPRTLIPAGKLDPGALSIPTPLFRRFYQPPSDPFSPEIFIHHQGRDSSETSGGMKKGSKMKGEEPDHFFLGLGYPGAVCIAGRKGGDFFPDLHWFGGISELPQEFGHLRSVMKFSLFDGYFFHALFI